MPPIALPLIRSWRADALRPRARRARAECSRVQRPAKRGGWGRPECSSRGWEVAAHALPIALRSSIQIAAFETSARECAPWGRRGSVPERGRAPKPGRQLHGTVVRALFFLSFSRSGVLGRGWPPHTAARCLLGRLVGDMWRCGARARLHPVGGGGRRCDHAPATRLGARDFHLHRAVAANQNVHKADALTAELRELRPLPNDDFDIRPRASNAPGGC